MRQVIEKLDATGSSSLKLVDFVSMYGLVPVVILIQYGLYESNGGITEGRTSVVLFFCAAAQAIHSAWDRGRVFLGLGSALVIVAGFNLFCYFFVTYSAIPFLIKLALGYVLLALIYGWDVWKERKGQTAGEPNKSGRTIPS
jgi:Zn-dependent protease with chaperone function